MKQKQIVASVKTFKFLKMKQYKQILNHLKAFLQILFKC